MPQIQNSGTVKIRALKSEDQPEWRRLWTGYLEYYETSVTDEVYRTTFARLLGDDPRDYHGLVAEQAGSLVGLTHYLFHRHCWRVERDLLGRARRESGLTDQRDWPLW